MKAASRSVVVALVWALGLLAAGRVGAAGGTVAADDPGTAVLPPELPWDGQSLELVAAAGDPWITPAEAKGFRTTPTYEETVAWLRRLVAAAPQLRLVTIGTSPEGRELWLVVASREGAATPEALSANGRPTLFAQAGIHAGEIDGKDAGLMLLRDLTVGGGEEELLDGANFLLLPIFNVDGHERSSPWGRMNQRGPAETGWRTTSRNLNLNRDYAKLDAPEMRALVAALGRWQPDLYLDLHVTDGIDYRYDVTFGFNGAHAYSPAVAGWLEETLAPALYRDLEEMGHIPGPLVFPVDALDLSRGIVDWTAGPRFSHGYGDARHLPSVLVENHSLKPYRQRVLGTYVLLRSALATLGGGGAALRRAVAEDRRRRPRELPLAFGVEGGEPPEMEFLGVRGERETSALTGGELIRWTGEPLTLTVPVLRMRQVTAAARRPRAYWIHPAWGGVIERLAVHGIAFETISEPRSLPVETLRFEEVSLADRPFEGHVRVSAVPVAERRTVELPAGSARVPTDQPLGDLAMLLLEPESPDSFFQWGFFLEILQRTEYAEAYALEPTAERMLAADPELARRYREAVDGDPELAGDPGARRQWLYRRTPYWDDRFRLYPVAREVEETEPAVQPRSEGHGPPAAHR